MDILSLTTSDQIRAVLTVSQADLPDDTLTSYGLEDDLAIDLESWVADYSSLTEEKDLRLLRVYAKYYCAALVASTASIFVLTKHTDGENEGQREPEELARLSGQLMAKASKVKSSLMETLNIATTSVTPTLVGISSPARDVITEARDVS